MHSLRSLFGNLAGGMRAIIRRGRRNAEIEEELRSFVDASAADKMQRGVSPEEAQRLARAEMGSAVTVRHKVWSAGWESAAESCVQDVRLSLRQLAKSPGFAAVAIATLALGIGANTAVFSTLNALLLRMLPVRNPQSLYTVMLENGGTQPPDTSGTGTGNTSFSLPVFEALRNDKRVFSELIAHIPLSTSKVPVLCGRRPMAVPGAEVSGNFFSGLGVPMELGRGLTEADEQNHSSDVVLSYGLWTEGFARSPEILGRTLMVKGVPFTIVGVAASVFHGVSPGYPMDFWIPLQNSPQLGAWGKPGKEGDVYGRPNWWAVPMVARLAAGVTPGQATAAVQAEFWRSATATLGHLAWKSWPAHVGFRQIQGIADYAHDYRTPVEIMMALVGLVLLIACTNVALLILARNSARQREFAIRIATGASQWRIFRQLLTESVLLVAGGSIAGWGLALAATRALAAWAKVGVGLAPDRTVLLFTLGVSVVVAIVFSLAPFRNTMRLSVEKALKSTSQNVSLSRTRVRGGNAAIAFQIAMCFTLLVAAGLTVRTLRNYEHQSLGMKAKKLLVFDVAPQGFNGNAQALAFYDRLLERLRAIPGVREAAVVRIRPGSGWLQSGGIRLDGRTLRTRDGARVGVYDNWVGADYFHTIGVPILQGRGITAADGWNSPPVIVVNEDFAREYLPHGALGHTIDGHYNIVGVVKDSKYKSVTEGKMPTIYFASAQSGMTGQMTVEVRAASDPMALLSTVRHVVRQIDPDLPLQNPETQAAQFERSYRTPELFERLALGFGLLAVLLVATGLYGTLVYRVQRRRGEIGIRMALGALRETVLWMVVRESLWMTATGFAVGLPLAFVVAHLLRSQLYHLSDLDPVSFAVAVGITLAVSLGATLLPAWRASRIQPMQALRCE